jgi:hypothetical protein
MVICMQQAYLKFDFLEGTLISPDRKSLQLLDRLGDIAADDSLIEDHSLRHTATPAIL